MNIAAKLKSCFLKSVCVCMTAFAVVSCYDDTDIRKQIDIIVNQLYELEQRMDSEIKALKSMLTGKVLISDISTNVSTGITTITLSDGNELQLLPEKDLESYITYITLGDGKAYWAYIGADGKKHLFLDSEEQPVPVLSETPEVVEEDGESYLVVGGVKYPLSGNSVFSDYELIKDELTGEVYAVTFTFGEDMTFTVSVDGTCGFYFVKSSGGFGQYEFISDYFVSYGLTERIQIDARGVVDYLLQIPDGWRVKEYEDIYMGARYFDITAPVKSLVESGVAMEEGELKVVAVLEGGKASVAKLNLTTDPFKVFQASLGKLYVEMNNGLQKYVCGVCSPESYDEAAIFEVAEGLLTAYDYPDGYKVCDYGLRGTDPAELSAEDLVCGNRYLLWAIPARYYSTSEDAGYYLEEGSAVTHEFTMYDTEFNVIAENYSDVEVSVKLSGADKYYMGVVPSEEYLLEDVLYSLNIPGYYTGTEWTYGEEGYTGSVFTLSGTVAEPDTEYMAWIAIAEEGRTYTQKDLIVCGFSTLNLLPGGSVSVVAGDVDSAPMNISVPLSAEGARSLYYVYMTVSDAKYYADDEAKAEYLLEYGKVVNAEDATAELSDFDIKIKPETSYVLWAMASDSNGMYGDILELPCATTELVYNDLQVDLQLLVNEPNNVVISVSAEGAEDFIYWIGRTADNTWKSSTYLGGSVETAQVFMYINPEHSRLVNVMNSYPVVDGKIICTNLTMNASYVIVAMAKDADGLYSMAKELRFEPRSVAVGNVVYATDSKWEAAKPTVEWLDDKFFAGSGQLGGQFGFTVTVPEGFTAYVFAGTDTYLNEGDDELVLSVEDKIIKIIEYVDRPRDWHLTVSDDWVWPHIGYVHYHNEHGAPLFGNAVIWADEAYHDSVCDCLGNCVIRKDINGYMVNVTYIVNLNDGKPLEFRQPQAVGSTEKVVDKVFVVCQDKQGNCYENFVFDVPVEKFQNAVGRDE